MLNLITQHFLTFNTEILNKFTDDKIKSNILYVKTILNLDGSSNIILGYYHPVFKMYHILKHVIPLNLTDFDIYIKNKDDYFDLVATELQIIIQEMYNRPCATTCDKCKLPECSHGEIVTKEYIETLS